MMFEILCSLTSIRCGFSPGACDVLQIDSAFTCEADRTVSAHIHGNPSREHPKANTPTTHISILYPGPLASLCSFLLKSTPVISVSMNSKIPTKIAGMMAAKIHGIDISLFMPPGLMNQPLLSCWVGLKPSVKGLLMDICCVMTLSPRAKSSRAIMSMAMTIPESLTSLRACKETKGNVFQLKRGYKLNESNHDGQ